MNQRSADLIKRIDGAVAEGAGSDLLSECRTEISLLADCATSFQTTLVTMAKNIEWHARAEAAENQLAIFKSTMVVQNHYRTKRVPFTSRRRP